MENCRKNRGNWIFWSFLKRFGVFGLLFVARSAPGVHVKCSQLRFRLGQTLSDDEKRVLQEELDGCEQEIDEAKQQDSLTIKKLKKPFSSGEDSL